MTQPVIFKFRLYTADDAPNSVEAIADLNTFCQTYLPGRHEIELVDVYKNPKRALADGVSMTPTLIKIAPAPVHRIVGTLGRAQTLLDAFGLKALVA
ncbi:MAG: circadian clock KaiB family protein [Tahibacter sp.]